MSGLPYVGKALSNLFKKPSTEAFPAGDPPKAAEHYRGRLNYDASKCMNCGMCTRVCAPQCMTRVESPATGEGHAEGDKKIEFTWDMTSCTYCGLCADFCSTKAITLTDDYMITGTKPEDFLIKGTVYKKAPPKFTPEQIAAMKAAAEAKRKAAAGGAAAPATPAAPASSAKPAATTAPVSSAAPAKPVDVAATTGTPAGKTE
ncbi:MAG: 4Fe-4S binding protein [Lachnospiraceae bacterium]|jgi:formate hydrogenlyase subunit 6/NADH:ubiquinone oxidoreductase subunit I|nr:4Fe-4S binding protein [Lachnospiraceae bacterium]